MNIEEVMYRDNENIDILFDQIVGARIIKTSYSSSEETENVGEFGAEGGVGKFLDFIGRISFVGKYLYRKKALNSRNHSYELTPEYKCNSIVLKMGIGSKIYRDPYDAWCAAKAKSEGLFCQIEGYFSPAGWRPDSRSWIDSANFNKMLVLKSVENDKFSIGMSLSKIIELRSGEINQSGHLARRLRPGRIKIRIFGKMTEGTYIKPYIIYYK